MNIYTLWLCSLGIETETLLERGYLLPVSLPHQVYFEETFLYIICI